MIGARGIYLDKEDRGLKENNLVSKFAIIIFIVSI
jgi:hypothetical protein